MPTCSPASTPVAALPVAAESFRAPFGAWGDPAGATVQDALRFTDAARIAGVRPVVWKGVRGWLLARYVDAWQMREGEIPEGRLLPLERRGVPTLDEYAALAGSLTEPQRAALAEFRPLARFPTLTIRKGYWGLFVFDALPTALRARSATALPLAALPPVTQARWRRAVVEQTYEGAPPGRLDRCSAQRSRAPGSRLPLREWERLGLRLRSDAARSGRRSSRALPGILLPLRRRGPVDRRVRADRSERLARSTGAGTVIIPSMTEIRGAMDARGKRVAIVVSR